MFNPITSYFATHQVSTGSGAAAIQYAAVNVSSGTTTLVAATTGKQIKVLSYLLVAGALATITWESEDGTVIGGPYTIAANGVVPAEFFGGLFATKVGQGLKIVTTAAVGGHIAYALV